MATVARNPVFLTLTVPGAIVTDNSMYSLNSNNNYDSSKILNDFFDHPTDDIYVLNHTISSPYFDSQCFIGEHGGSTKPLILNINAQSLQSKHEQLSEFILNLQQNGVCVDILVLQETWTVKHPELYAIDGYQGPILKTRTKSNGGGGLDSTLKMALNLKIFPLTIYSVKKYSKVQSLKYNLAKLQF